MDNITSDLSRDPVLQMKLDWIESKIGVLIILKTVQAIIIAGFQCHAIQNRSK